MMAEQLKPPQGQQRHQVAHVQAVRRRIESGVKDDRAGLQAFLQFRRVRAIGHQPAPFQFFKYIHRSCQTILRLARAADDFADDPGRLPVRANESQRRVRLFRRHDQRSCRYPC